MKKIYHNQDFILIWFQQIIGSKLFNKSILYLIVL